MFGLEDIENSDVSRKICPRTARVICSSDTHGVIVDRDWDHPEDLRICLVGHHPGGPYAPYIKAHNRLSPEEALQLAHSLISLVKSDLLAAQA